MASGRQVGPPKARSAIGAGGVVRRIDELGRIVIPVEIRRRLGIEVHDPLEIGVRGDTITLSTPHDVCVFCGTRSGLTEYHGRHVCAGCRIELAGGVISR
jgi:AbrB family transcriptional regulator, transcriptional pleiotropic regulator of transition state genes